jgi:hypothetical protein
VPVQGGLSVPVQGGLSVPVVWGAALKPLRPGAQPASRIVHPALPPAHTNSQRPPPTGPVHPLEHVAAASSGRRASSGELLPGWRAASSPPSQQSSTATSWSKSAAGTSSEPRQPHKSSGTALRKSPRRAPVPPWHTCSACPCTRRLRPAGCPRPAGTPLNDHDFARILMALDKSLIACPPSRVCRPGGAASGCGG